MLEIFSHTLDVFLQQLILGLGEESERQAEDDLPALAEEAVHDPAGQGDGHTGGEQGEEPPAGKQVGVDGLRL